MAAPQSWQNCCIREANSYLVIKYWLVGWDLLSETKKSGGEHDDTNGQRHGDDDEDRGPWKGKSWNHKINNSL